MKKWQYLVITMLNKEDGIMADILDTYGRNGWELVGITNTTSGQIKFVFKMEIQ